MMFTSSKKQISRENSIAACLNPRQTAVGAAAAPQLNANISGGKNSMDGNDFLSRYLPAQLVR